MSNDTEVFENFCQAAAAMLEAGLTFARKDNPEAYAETLRACSGDVQPTLVCEFSPLAVCLRLSGHNAAGERLEVEVFRYQTQGTARVVAVN